MNGSPTALALITPMTTKQLDAVMAIESVAYAFPWSRGNFVDSLAAGHLAQVLRGADGELLGYLLAMRGFEEMHLLNLTVTPVEHGQGLGRCMLQWLVQECRHQHARTLWLEVRQSNAQARRVYERFGFVHIGDRKRYYPAAHGSREDAVVMSLDIAPQGPEARHAVD